MNTALNARYSELCTKLGDIQIRLELLGAQKAEIVEQINALNMLSKSLKESTPSSASKEAAEKGS